jgi:hypothetical protein
MPDTPGKRQRDAQKAKKREAKEERRAARKAGTLVPSPGYDDPIPGFDDEQADAPQPDGEDTGNAGNTDESSPEP